MDKVRAIENDCAPACQPFGIMAWHSDKRTNIKFAKRRSRASYINVERRHPFDALSLI